MTLPVSVRLAVPDDLRFISASWFESYWKATAREEGVSYDDYRAGQDATIRRLVARSRVVVAHATDIPDEIMGYSVIEGTTLHYVYVKSVYRRHGIAKGLTQGRVAKFTHRTRMGKKLVEKLGLQFNPYLAH